MRITTDAKLTKRENEVLRFLARGCTRSQIAKKLFISDETVKMHIKNIYKKLKAKNKIDALIKMKMI
jgi:LuxR family transcriptional regulator of csgAB operon